MLRDLMTMMRVIPESMQKSIFCIVRTIYEDQVSEGNISPVQLPSVQADCASEVCRCVSTVRDANGQGAAVHSISAQGAKKD